MSTISAGTTSNTALKQTGDTTGNLVLQTNGTTTAVTIDTSQNVTLAKNLVMNGSTSGSVTIAAPATAGTQSYTLPTAVPAANGYALTSTTGGVMSWSAVTASPAGSTTQFQYNNAGTTAGAANLTYSANGPVVTSLGVGSTTPSASGAGIAFPATQSASTDANTLDDYEEGTWTPTDGSGSGLTITNSGGCTYTKIGRMVYIQGFLAYPTTASANTAIINGLPFAPRAGDLCNTVPEVVSGGTVTTSTGLCLFFGNAAAPTGFYMRSAFGNTSYTNTQMSAINYMFSMVYATT